MEKVIVKCFVIVCVLAIISCVPNRKYVYLQKDDLGKKGLPRDSIVRRYYVDTFQYRVQPNDIISVRFESLTPKDFDFLNASPAMPPSGGVSIQTNALLIGELIDEEGFIYYPVVGKVKVAGLTIFELQEKLRIMAALYLESPVVKVRLINYRATILGEVNKEGTIQFNNNRVTMLEAVGLSGGFTDLAEKAQIKLIRQKGTDVEVVYLDLLNESFINSPYYYVHQNDVIIVPALRQRAFRKYFGQNLALVVSSLSLLLLTMNFLQQNAK
jgi:polysaccharide export outer membrane protein